MNLRSTQVALLAASFVLTGCGSGAVATADRSADNAAGAPAPSASAASSQPSAQSAPDQIPDLGPETLAEIPADSRQAVVVTGKARGSSTSEVVLYRRTADGWQAGAAWPAHNAYKGWSDHHMVGDLQSPIGVFTLTDAGGLLKDPGSKLPYHQSGSFVAPGKGFEGEALAGSFDYVVAINYNRKPGTSPLDWTRPLGAERGGGIWLHVDHGGPTHGCVSVSEAHMKQLLRTLDPALHPVVVMGDAASLAN
ncbi:MULTISPECIES: L,D-transpeptidase family protein [unclassified Streptomyces]|uniref:L,D-transpeptidase family protein n=1 Tax=unclassified Streptomyces TaxID=2593676 RepID=UPI0037F10420